MSTNEALELKRKNTPVYVKLFFAAGLLLCGGFTTLGMDTAFGMYSYFETDPITGKPKYHSFEYEWFTNSIMFLGMAICLIPWAFERKRAHRELREAIASGAIPPDDPRCNDTRTTWQKIKPGLFLAIPTMFDLVASGIGALSMGTFTVPASVYQMLNGSIMIFTPLLSIVFLHRRATCVEWWGIGLNLFGLIFVGLSATLNQQAAGEEAVESSSALDLVIGMLCCLIAQLIYAFQFVVEEKTMADMATTPNMVVGLEGGFGFIIMVAIVSPIFAAVGYENDLNALTMIGNQPLILVPLAVFILAIALYNFCGQNVTQLLNCTTRTILEALRALVVWLLALIEHYASVGIAQKSKETDPMWRLNIFGDEWGPYSWVQLIGFAFLVLGSLIFNENIPMPKKLVCNCACVQPKKKKEVGGGEIENKGETGILSLSDTPDQDVEEERL